MSLPENVLDQPRAPTAQELGMTEEEYGQLLVLQDPVAWADVYLNWYARDYQVEPLQAVADSRRLVYRMGRRLGKTRMMCVSMLWHAWTQPNIKPDELEKPPGKREYNILVICPFEAQVSEIFDTLHKLIDSASPIIKQSVSRDIQHRIEFANGTVIKGLTAGAKSKTGAANTRGQRADVLVLDEIEFGNANDLDNILRIADEDQARIRIHASSTPIGKREHFWKWCTGVIKGWRHFHRPSSVNKELQKINPDTGQSYLDDLRDEMPELKFQQEVMAEFGEEQAGVFQKKYLDLAFDYAREHGWLKYNAEPYAKPGPRVLGVDWDVVQATPTLVGVEWVPEIGKFRPFLRESIPKSEFTLDFAVRRIIEAMADWDIDWCIADRGFGEMQVEVLKKHGVDHPETGLHHKVIGVSFRQNVEVRDPYTKQKVKKMLKHFSVSNAQVILEREQLVLIPGDIQMKHQMEDYRVVSYSTAGPVYTDENEHIVDGLTLALYGMTLKYGDIMKVRVAKTMLRIPHPLDQQPVTQQRDLAAEQPKKTGLIAVAVGSPFGRYGRSPRMPARPRI